MLPGYFPALHRCATLTLPLLPLGVPTQLRYTFGLERQVVALAALAAATPEKAEETNHVASEGEAHSPTLEGAASAA